MKNPYIHIRFIRFSLAVVLVFLMGTSAIQAGPEPVFAKDAIDRLYNVTGDSIIYIFGTDTLRVSPAGIYMSDDITLTGNIYTGDTATGDVDVYHYFSTNGSWTSEYFRWDDGNARFEISDELLATHLFASEWGQAYTSWRIGDATGPSTPSLFFFDAGTTTGEYLRFDTVDASDKFELSNDIDITGNITLSGTVDGVDVSVHAADDDAHHNRSHAMTTTLDHTGSNWKSFLSNGSGAVIELTHGGSGQVLTSNGVTLSPTWQTPGTGSSVEILESNVSKDDPLVILNFMLGFDVIVANDTSYVTLDFTEDQIDLTTEVTGVLPDGNVANNITVDEASDVDTSGTKISAALGTRMDNTGDTVTGTYNFSGGPLEFVRMIDFDDTITAPSHSEGRVFYDKTDNTLSYYNNEADVTMNIGQEGWVYVRNVTGSTILDGKVVSITGAVSSRPTITLARADDVDSCKLLGVATHDIETATNGYVTIWGIVRGINLSGFSDGDEVFLSATVAGTLTTVQPSAPNCVIEVGYVVDASANGDLFVLLGKNKSLNMLQDVLISGPATGNALVYNGTVWVNSGSIPLADSTSAVYSGDVIMDTSSVPTYVTLEDWWDVSQSAMIISGGTVTQDATDSTVIDIAAGAAQAKKTDSDIGENVFFDFSSGNDIAVADNTQLLVYVDYNGGSPILATTAATSVNFTTQVVLGRVHRLGNHMHITQGGQNFTNFNVKNSFRIYELYDLHRGSGLITVEGADASNDIDISAGAFYLGNNRQTVSAAASFTDGIELWYGDGAGGFTQYDTTALNDISYDDGDGTRAALQTNRYNIFWVFMETDGELVAIYDSVTQSGGYSLGAAQAKTVVTTLPSVEASAGVFVGKIIVQEGAGITSIEYPWAVTFAGAATADHGNLAGLGDDDHTQYLKESDTNAYSTTILLSADTAMEESLDGYSLTSVIASTYETITNVAKIGDDTANFKIAYGWGDHSAQNYLDNDDANVDTAAWNAAGTGVWDEIDGATKDTVRWVAPNADTGLVIESDGSGNTILTVGNESDNTATTLRVKADTLDLGGDVISEFAGTGLDVVSNELTNALGTSIENTEMADGDHGDFTYSTSTATLDANVVGATEIATGVVDSTHLATGAVDSAELKNGAVTLPKIDFKRRYADTTGDSIFFRYSDTAGVALSTADQDANFLGYTTFKGNVSYWGVINKLDYMNARAEHATTYLKLPQSGDYVAGDSAQCIHCDSSHQIHPAFIYAPEGLYANSNDTMTNGYRRQNRRVLGVGPLCTQDYQENPHFLVKDEKYGWHEFFVGIESTWTCSGDDSIPIGFIDSTANNPIYDREDSLFFRGDAWNSGDSSWDVNVGGAGHLSDQALFLDFKDTLYMPFRGTWTTPSPDTHMIAIGYTANGYQWSEGIVILSEELCTNRGDSAPDRSLGTANWEFKSPTIIPDTGGTYEMWTIENNNLGTDSNYIVKWEAPKADSGWRWVRGPGVLGRCVYTPYNAGCEPWHMRVKRRGRDELLALVAEQPIGQTGTNTYLTIAVSYDDGLTWTGSDTVLAAGDDDWNDTRVYFGDGAWVNEGNRSYFELYYTAYGAGHGWATAQTELRFDGFDEKKMEALIWNPDLITDTVSIFEVDSAIYQDGIKIVSVAIQTSVDGTYALKLMSFTAADPPVFHDWIDTLNVGASDQRASSETFEDADASSVDRGQFIYMLTPATDIDWIRVKIRYYIRDYD